MVEQLREIGWQFWGVLGEMAPYLLFGFLVAGVLSVLIAPEIVERHLGGRGPWPVVKAALLGVPLPLCSCSVIPVATSLRQHGASRGATTSFLLSTPQTGVDSILVSYSLLGLVFAIYQPLAAFFTGLVGGWLVTVFGGDRQDATSSGPGCTAECCAVDKRGSALGRAFRYGFIALPRDLAGSLLVGLLIAGVLAVAVPEQFFSRMFGTGLVPMLILMVVGIPIYVCATASVPVALALIEKGITPGAALVFLMTGPATNAATIAAVWKVLGRRTAFLYLGSVAGCALAAGLLLDSIYVATGAGAVADTHWEIPMPVKTVTAVVLLGILFAAISHRILRGSRPEEAMASGQTETLVLTVAGMTCSHCEEAVRQALAACAGVESVAVDVNSGKAVVSGTGLDGSLLQRVVEKIGYDVIGVGH